MSDKFTFTLWDVGHGLSMWVETPNGQNHWLDCGGNDDFSPAAHVNDAYEVKSIDYLIISHPDSDHLRDLPNLVEKMGAPKAILHNRTLPDSEKFKSGQFNYQDVFRSLDAKYTSTVDDSVNPNKPVNNGGIEIKTRYNSFSQQITGNNTSVVALYSYAGWLFVFPGDIEDLGWKALWEKVKTDWEPFIANAHWRVLVAPHHGRPSGYSQSLMDSIKPSIVIVSDEAGPSGTDRRFRENPSGLNLVVAPETEKKLVRFLSTKRGGRIRMSIDSDGTYQLHQYEYEYWK